MASILIVEDEALLAKNIGRTLEKLGHSVAVAPTCGEGARLFGELRPDVTLLDLRLPDGSGLDLLVRLREQRAGADVLIMTAYATIEEAVSAIKLGARDYLQKPLHMEDVRHAVTRALEEGQLKTELSYYRSREARGATIDDIVGTCAPIEELRGKLRRLCALPASAAPPTVLLTGETGTGKGLIARVLHYNGARADRPFIEINCAALPESLVESELFGHERGAFTDARTAKAGLFQAAHRGTLFLDEIGCLPLGMQVKILKVIEEKTVRPVGGGSARTIDVQVIAATNGDLETMVRHGTFREDLYYRLCVAHLVVPPLRARGADVTVLARQFVRELCGRYRLPEKGLSPEAERCILQYAWPGNIRELRNTLDRAVLFGEGGPIGPAALGLPETGSAEIKLGVDERGEVRLQIPDGGIVFDAVERALLVEALRRSGGSQSGAARLLGMTRATLRYRLEKFGIESAPPREH
jgi:two-component system, NtrC family, response regulator AtoC